MRLDFLESLFEGTGEGPRIPHPEDAIFQGSASAERYFKTLLELIDNPQKVSIKWDGEVALFFGRTGRGEFFISDKYMYGAGFEGTSIEKWIEWDKNKKSGTLRPDLYKKLEYIWSGLESAVQGGPVVFKGDLMFAGQLRPVNGNFVFKGPTVTYTIPENSPIGQLISGRDGLIVVHAMNNQPWDGKSGLVTNGPVAILDPTAGNKFKLDEPVQLVTQAQRALSQLGPDADQFLSGLTGVAKSKIQTYFNKKITGQVHQDISHWLHTTDPTQYRKLIGDNQDGYLYQNIQGFNALKTIWNSIYQLKVNISLQLEKQIKNIGQTIGPMHGGEGFVFPSSTGLVKLVNRGVFGQAHFNK